MFAGHFMSHVLGGSTKLAAAVGAGSVKGHHFHGRIVSEWLIAVFALHFQAFVLSVNSQLFAAARTQDVMPFGRYSGDHGKLRQR